MSILSPGFWSHGLEFLLPVFVYLFCFCFLSTRQCFFKNRSLIWGPSVILSFSKEVLCWHFAGSCLEALSMVYHLVPISDWDDSKFSFGLWKVKSISSSLLFLRFSIKSLECLQNPSFGWVLSFNFHPSFPIS